MAFERGEYAPGMSDALEALRTSVDRLTRLVQPLGDAVSRPAYPSEWAIADVLSHLGSGAVIFQRRLDDALAGRDTPEGFSEAVWAEWNTKSPQAKAVDGIAADSAFTARLEALAPDERAAVQIAMGPMVLGWGMLVGMRLNEHLLHEWDVAVALDPSASLAADGTSEVIDNLDLIARFTARPGDQTGTVVVTTSGSERNFEIVLAPDHIDFRRVDGPADPTVTMPAEALIRLVYGRLDPAHTPTEVVGDPAVLDALRAVFPGP